MAGLVTAFDNSVVFNISQLPYYNDKIQFPIVFGANFSYDA